VGSGIRPADVIADLTFKFCGDERRPTAGPIKTTVEDWNELTVI
jgi:hypothetical protein